MKTGVLIELLAKGAGPAPAAVAARRLWPAALLGFLFSVAIALGLADLLPASAFRSPAPWIKLGYAAALAGTAGWLTARLSRPLARLSSPRRALLSVVATMALFGALSLLAAAPAERREWLLGETWWSCPWSVLVYSLPALCGTLWAARGLAITRPGAAGLTAGLLAGAVGAMGYALTCPEVSPTFIAIWYSIGMPPTVATSATPAAAFNCGAM